MSAGRPRPLGSSVVINSAIILVGVIAILVVLVGQLVSEDDPGRAGEPLDLALELEPVAEGLEGPVLLAGPGDGSGDRYVVEQRGRIVRLAPDGSLDPEPLLDISERVLHHHERGLLGLAFDPAFAETGTFYVAYTRDADGATSVSRFTRPAASDPDADAVEDSEMVLLTIPQPYTTHKAGMLAFDRDGMLLISTGDGGLGEGAHRNGQDRFSLLGKVLRVDPHRGWPYAIPDDNGFAGDPEARPEIHALGLRNPWRFSVDRATGDLYIADVGDRTWEEVNVLPRGSSGVSFGWSDMEGEGCFARADCEPAAHARPAVVYPHEDGDTGHCAVVGGYAYRGDAGSLPDGTYLYADYCSGTIWAVPSAQLVAGTAAPTVVGQVPADIGQVQAFGEDDEGELYLLTSEGHVLGVHAADAGAADAGAADAGVSPAA